MALNFTILAVRRDCDTQLASGQIKDGLNEATVLAKYITNNLAGNVNVIQLAKCDKKKIKEDLIFLSNKYSGNTILLIGDTLSDVIHDAIEEVINKNVRIDINMLITSLTEGLECFIIRPICGILNRSLIINMCGPYRNAQASLEAFGNTILDILCLINNPDEEIFYVKEEECVDSCVEPFNNNNGNTNDDNNDNNGNNSADEFDNNGCNYDEQFDENNINDFDSFYNDNSKPSTSNDKTNDNTNDIHDFDKMPMEVSFEEQPLKTLSMDYFCKKQEESKVVSLEDAQNIMKTIIYKYHKIYSETVRTNDAYGRVIAKDIYSSVNVPRCCVSTKHGYAVLASDGKGVRKVLKANLMLIKKISIVPGICIRVRSGDPIPDGATAVVKSVNTKIIDEDDNINYFNIDNMEYEIMVLVAPEEGENIKKAGCEIKSNELIKYSYSRIKTADLGILTLCDIDSITVIKLPSVGLLCIGYDVLRPGNTSTLGRIYDCNKIIVSSLLKKNGYNLMDFGISAYEPNVMQYRIKDALEKVDLLVIIGRTNDKDTLKCTLKTCFDANIHFGGVNIKPGKSTTFATCMFNEKRKFFLCMSANPATVPIITHVLLLPLLDILQDNSDNNILKIGTRIKTSHDLHQRPKLSWTSLEWSEKTVDLYPSAHSINVEHQHMSKYQFSNALLMLPRHTPEVPKLDADSAFLTAMFMGN